jgi:hypothetical protein
MRCDDDHDDADAAAAAAAADDDDDSSNDEGKGTSVMSLSTLLECSINPKW